MKNIKSIIKTAILEDCSQNDITAKYAVDSKKKVKADIVAGQRGVISGLFLIKQILDLQKKGCRVVLYAKDGKEVKKGKVIASIYGPAVTILSSERTILNFISHLSGISTLTSRFVKKAGKKTKIFDTRKTTPGLRVLEKYAVKCAGGYNHRFSLFDMAMIKDNHRKAISDLTQSIKNLRKHARYAKIELECDNIRQVKEALENDVDIIMLDNMRGRTLKKAVDIIRKGPGKKVEIEVSGGINLKNISKVGKYDIDRISIGALTHSAPQIDLSMEIECL